MISIPAAMSSWPTWAAGLAFPSIEERFDWVSQPQLSCPAPSPLGLILVALPGVEGPRDPWRILHELPPRPERPRDRSKRLVDYLVDDPLDLVALDASLEPA
jgi:hypothetical protein